MNLSSDTRGSRVVSRMVWETKPYVTIISRSTVAMVGVIFLSYPGAIHWAMQKVLGPKRNSTASCG